MSFKDTRVFSPQAVNPRTAEFNARLETAQAGQPPTHTQPLEQTRQAREEGKGVWGPLTVSRRAETLEVDGPGGPLGLRVFRRPGARGVYLHIHGGGFCLGRAHHHDGALEMIAERMNVAVVSVDYRLAPENPFPAAARDCEAAALWLVQNAAAEFGATRLVIGGESAGANLAALTLISLRGRPGGDAFLAANLTYGVYDLSLTPSARRWGEHSLLLSTPLMEWFHAHYLPPGQDPTAAAVSPLYADLRGLPPAIFTVGTLDPLLDDSMFMYARWAAAGNEAELKIYPGGAHGFNGFPIPLAQEANDNILAFMKARLA